MRRNDKPNDKSIPKYIGMRTDAQQREHMMRVHRGDYKPRPVKDYASLRK